MSKLIVFVDLDRKWARPFLEEALTGADYELVFFFEPLGAAMDHLGERRKDVAVLSPFISSEVNRAAMEAMPSLGLIATRSTGFDHVDLEEARRRGIAVSNVPLYGENTVAEHTFALILSLSRKLRETYEKVRRDEFNLAALEGFDLRGKTIGVVGAGHIGLRVIQIARGFSMNVLAYDPGENLLLADILSFRYAGLDELLSRSDIVSLHCPYTPRTRHLINAETLRQMKPGALLINTARGGLVDTSALVEALRTGHIAGAGLDVLEHESTLFSEDQARAGLYNLEEMRATVLNHMLLKRDNVVFTPHLGFNSREANERILSTTVRNIRAFLESSPENLV
jgi:D-lactate dehydrogenase